MRIPKAMVDALGMQAGSELTIEMSSEGAHITIRPARDERPIRGRYRIEDLVAASSAESLGGEVEWGDPQGKEAW